MVDGFEHRLWQAVPGWVQTLTQVSTRPDTQVAAMTSDARVLVGYSTRLYFPYAFWWTRQTGEVPLPLPPGAQSVMARRLRKTATRWWVVSRSTISGSRLCGADRATGSPTEASTLPCRRPQHHRSGRFGRRQDYRRELSGWRNKGVLLAGWRVPLCPCFHHSD